RHHEDGHRARRTLATGLPHRADGRRLLHRHRQRLAHPGLSGAADVRILLMAPIPRRLAGAGLALVLLPLAGCTRGADESRLQADLQTRLNRDVKPGLFRIVTLKRLGSAPMPAGESGKPRVVVYFNTTLELAQGYSFGSWD